MATEYRRLFLNLVNQLGILSPYVKCSPNADASDEGSSIRRPCFEAPFFFPHTLSQFFFYFLIPLSHEPNWDSKIAGYVLMAAANSPIAGAPADPAAHRAGLGGVGCVAISADDRSCYLGYYGVFDLLRVPLVN